MLELEVPERELYDEVNNRFFVSKGAKLKLEHSLISISKWEEKYHIPFLHSEEKTKEQILYYIKCMTMNQVDDDVYKYLSSDIIRKIVEYIQDPHTATWFNEKVKEGQAKKKGEIVTAEIIYYWMIELGVPIEFQKWHLEKLLTLIKVIQIKRQKEEKMSPKQAAMQRKMLNAQRRAKMHSRG